MSGATVNQNSVHSRLDECVKALFCMGPDMPPSLIGLEGTAICIPSPDWWLVPALLHRAEPRDIKREAKPSLALSFGGGPFSRLGSVLSCLFNKSSVCLCCY